MGKSCCAVGCANHYEKGSGIHFYRFPKEKDRRLKWINAVAAKIGNLQGIRGFVVLILICFWIKDDDPLSLAYKPSLFSHIKSPRLKEGMKRFERVSQAKRRRVEIGDKQEAARSLSTLFENGNGTSYCEPHSSIVTMTALTMKDLSEFEADRAKLQEIQKLNLKLVEEKRNLTVECAALRGENKALKEEREQSIEGGV